MEYQYDQFGRLTRANTRHDGFGNLTQQSVTKGQMPAFTLSINRVHTIYSTQCYKTSIFPARNERLVPKRDQDRPRVHFHSAGGRLLQIGGEWVATDRLGSVVRKGTTNYKYAPYGQEIEGATAKGTTKFATYTRDSLSGLDYALNRYYKPEWGRFTSPDPLQPGTAERPSSWNYYAYTEGDPINFSDPEGLDRIEACDPRYSRTGHVDADCAQVLNGGGGGFSGFRETFDSMRWEASMASRRFASVLRGFMGSSGSTPSVTSTISYPQDDVPLSPSATRVLGRVGESTQALTSPYFWAAWTAAAGTAGVAASALPAQGLFTLGDAPIVLYRSVGIPELQSILSIGMYSQGRQSAEFGKYFSLTFQGASQYAQMFGTRIGQDAPYWITSGSLPARWIPQVTSVDRGISSVVIRPGLLSGMGRPSVYSGIGWNRLP